MHSMPTKATRSPRPVKPSARDRLLTAASELFYAEGVHTVGIDRIIEQAGVAKASLYSTFGNKEGLVSAYLDGRHAIARERVERTLARFRTPRERLLGVFDEVGEQVTRPGFNGCAFVAASAESHSGGAVEVAADHHRAWMRGFLAQLAAEAEVADPERLAHQLHMLYDAAVLSGRMDRDPSAATSARDAAAVLYDAAPKTTPATARLVPTAPTGGVARSDGAAPVES
ncbi:TetR/AcrR family transcriptional regulator [Streptomyces sp. NPDC006923]|uniref:TetR/AcrR family transcriptional regulator n=1 Tax=Streptomyces sp. NPDC006923 TaxID=3155355 RepID=UPI0033FA606C